MSSTLLASARADGENGRVWAHDIPSGENRIDRNDLRYVQAIVGIWIERATGRLFVLNDGGPPYDTASPRLNIAMSYAI